VWEEGYTLLQGLEAAAAPGSPRRQHSVCVCVWCVPPQCGLCPTFEEAWRAWLDNHSLAVL
jgi:hypothetical protein